LEPRACGYSTSEEHVAAIQAFVDAGFDEIHVGQIGPDHAGFVDCYASEILRGPISPRRPPAGAGAGG
jgi:hypothetical protein